MDVSFPKYVRYDFLIFLVGLGLMYFSFYYIFVHPLENLVKIAFIFIFSLGGFIFIMGIGDMYNNYTIEMEQILLNSIVERNSVIEQLKEKKIITVEEETAFHYFLKEQLADYLEKKKTK